MHSIARQKGTDSPRRISVIMIVVFIIIIIVTVTSVIERMLDLLFGVYMILFCSTCATILPWGVRKGRKIVMACLSVNIRCDCSAGGVTVVLNYARSSTVVNILMTFQSSVTTDSHPRCQCQLKPGVSQALHV